MSQFDDLEKAWDNGDESALIALDAAESIFVTRGAIGTGDWFRDPCNCPDDDCPGKQGGSFKVISLLLEDTNGKEYTILIPAETQIAEMLLDHETIEALRNGIGA